MSGRTPYMTDSWKAGVEVGRPTLIRVNRQPRCRRSRARNGAAPSASPCSSTAREAVDLDDQQAACRRRGRRAEAASPHEPVEQALEAEDEVVEGHRPLL